MTLVDLLIPPALDAKQALRLRRFGFAMLNYVLATGLAGVAWAFGELPASAVFAAAGAFVVVNALLYAVFRSGFNLRFADPSLTRIQMVAAITILMYIVYHMDNGRDIGLFGCFVVFLFGIFRLRVREFVGVTLYTLAAYALVINLLMHLRPEAIHHVPNEWMTWLGLAGFLPCFVIIGGQIHKLRLAMRESESRLRHLSEMSSDFYWETDAEHRLTDRGFNAGKRGGPSIFLRGVQIGERRWDVACLSPDEAGWRAHRADLDAHRPFREFHNSRIGADGTECHVALSGDPVFDAAGAFKGYRGVGTDITARKRAEQALRDSAHQLRVFADNIPAMTVSWDENLRCRFANKVCADYYGFNLDDIVGKHLSDLLGQDVYREVQGHFAQALQGHPVTYQRTRVRRGGESRDLEVRVLPHLGDHGKVQGCFSMTTDITERKRTEKRIRHAAHHDSLTGLPNRLLFNDRLEQAITRAQRNGIQFALLYLDLDRFKPVNDTLGHAAGDELLKALPPRIRREVRESDTVARIGGDEFAVILHDAGRAQATAVAAKIAAAVATPFQVGAGNQGVGIGASIGIAIYPQDALTADALVLAADAAMYAAKQAA